MSLIDKGLSVSLALEVLSEWLEDDHVTEIAINRPQEVFIERNNQWEVHHVDEANYDYCSDLGVAVGTYSGTALDATHPILSATLPKGERIQVVIPPACESGTISITIRKPSSGIIGLDTYEKSGFFDTIKPVSNELTSDEIELQNLLSASKYNTFLKRAVQLEKNIIIAGETGSGKTTFMKSLMQCINAESRIITIEDVPELFLPSHPNHVHLFYPSEASEEKNSVVTSASLLRSCLRMKPDRILLAELRGPETFDFINVCASGHGGSITSCHAGSAKLTFERLALMCLQNRQGRTLPYEVIQKLLYMVVDIVVHVHNDVTGGSGRHITEIWYDPSKKRSLA